MNRNQYRPGHVLASLLQSRNVFLSCFLAALLALNIHPVFASDTAPSKGTTIQKLQASFDALAKKETPEKGDWKGLYKVCSGLYEIRDFSRIFGCVGIAER